MKQPKGKQGPVEQGQQANDSEIEQAQIQILSQIECEYNAETLKRQQIKGDASVGARTIELYKLGLNTLKAIMNVLRLSKEWETVTRFQYLPDDNIDAEKCITLLVRCHKLYDAKQMVEQILKWVLDKERLGENREKLRKLNQRIQQ